MTKKYDDDALESVFNSPSIQSLTLGTASNLGVGRSTASSSFSQVGHKTIPSLAFVYNGIEYWGSAHSSLDDFYFKDNDLIVNAYGLEYISKPFVKQLPSWLDLEDTSPVPNQIIFDWKDFSVPPQSINIDFWESLIEQSHAEGIKRIIVCCGAGLGRTGTALAALMLASGYTKEPDEAIFNIRDEYNRRAIETKQQELYIWRLVTPEHKIPISKIFDAPK